MDGTAANIVPQGLAHSRDPRARQCGAVCMGHVQSLAGDHPGCGMGEIDHADVHWQTESDGVNHEPVP